MSGTMPHMNNTQANNAVAILQDRIHRQNWQRDDGQNWHGDQLAERLSSLGVYDGRNAAYEAIASTSVGDVIKTGVSGYTRTR